VFERPFLCCVVATTTVVCLVTLVPNSASAVTRKTFGTGSVTCSFSTMFRFSPPLTTSGGGTNPTKFKARLSGCTTYGLTPPTVPGGIFSGTFAASPFSCVTASPTGAPVSMGSVRWERGLSAGQRTQFIISSISANNVIGSFQGTTRMVITSPTSLASSCAAGAVRSVAVAGTLTMGPDCGPASSPVTIYQIVPGPVCGGVYAPNNITSGPDGALWFTNAGQQEIGRISTSGVVTIYRLPAHTVADNIVAGPDGALWFTDAYSIGTTAIGRISTAGAVTLYPISGLPWPITAGPDGAIWFAASVPVSPGSLNLVESIERMTTSGVVTNVYTDPGFAGLHTLTTGPDGALWFTNLGASATPIGRMTTSGSVTTYADPNAVDIESITAASDGALWFANGSTIGRVTTSGLVTIYSDPALRINHPWAITAGPDGALWFTNYSDQSVGRITTSGVVTSYYHDPSILLPYDITAGPDGAVWFVNKGSDTIGRIPVP